MKIDWSGRCSTPAGNAGQVRPRRAKPEEAHRQPRGKRAPAAEIKPLAI
ncbi:hypothetical protein [Rossellomorea arthrocnemi]|nr:hypothetical protein [Rossellomorea arthrocnemi]